MLHVTDRPFRKQTIRLLFESRAFLIRTDKPFKLTSNLYSPYYIDCRQLLFHVEGRSRIADYAASIIKHKIGLENVDAVAGGVTAGVPLATLVADRLRLPLTYIRQQPKSYGTTRQVEGGRVQGKRVVLLDDVIVDGESKECFAGALRQQGAIVEHTLVIFSRAQQRAFDRLGTLGIKLHALSTFDDMLRSLQEMDMVSPESLREIKEFRADPAAWSAAHGGAG